MIDMHSHIVYGVDDGAQDEETTLLMLKTAEMSGTRKIVATPHFRKGRYVCDYQEILEKVDIIRRLAKENQIGIEIFPAQEIYYHRDLIHFYNDKLIGTINNSKYMLVELPMYEFDLDEVIDRIYELTLRGIVPILAHPERYKPFIKKPSLINRLIKEGYLFQLNSGSLLGEFGKDVQKLAQKYYDNGIYSVIGSDAHSDKIRNTNMAPLKEKIEDINKFTVNAEKILNNEDIEFNGKLIEEKRKLFGIFSI